MVSLTQGEISLHGRTEKVLRYEVWFRSPVGLHTTLPEALAKCEEYDMPGSTLIPVAVAVGPGDLYEEIGR